MMGWGPEMAFLAAAFLVIWQREAQKAFILLDWACRQS